MSHIPGLQAFLQATPVLQISTGATSTTPGPVCLHVSGIDSKEVYKAALDLIPAMHARKIPNFCSRNSDLKLNTPNLEIDILRDQAVSYGVTRRQYSTR